MRTWLVRLLDAIRAWRRRHARYVLDTVKVTSTEVDVAIAAACAKCGVTNANDVAPDRDLGHKWHDVLVLAGRSLGYRTSTVQDLREWLQ